MVKKALSFLLIIFLLFTLTSCWDQLEIEDQAFIIGLGLDKSEDSDNILVTFQIAQPQAFVAGAQESEPYWNIVEEAKDISEAREQLLRKSNWIPTMEHCQVILVGEGLARDGLKGYFDYIMRTHEIRRRLSVAVVQGKAQDVLDIKFNSGLIPSFVVSEMLKQNSQYSLEITDYMTLGQLHMSDVESYDFILSRVIPMKDKLDMSGGAVFSKSKMVGWFSGVELTGARFLRGDVSAGSLLVDLPSDIGERAMLRIFEAKSYLKPEIRDGRLYAVLEAVIEGDIDEIVNATGALDETALIQRCTEVFESHLISLTTRAFKKAQLELASDPFRLKEKVKSYYTDFWRKNKDNWDEIYEAAVLEPDVRVFIRRVGEISH